MSATAIQQWLDTYCDDGKNAVVGGLVMVTRPRDGALVVAAQWPKQASQGTELMAAAKAAVEDQAGFINDRGNPDSVRSDTSRVVSLPLRAGNRAVGAIALELGADGAQARRAAFEGLERAASSIASALGAVAPSAVLLDAGQVLQFQATVLSHDKFNAAATGFASELASSLHFDRVSVGFVDNGYASVVAISHSADFQSRAELFRAIGSAMEEAIEQGATIAYPGAPDDKPRVRLAHAEFVKRQGGAVCTIPLVSRGKAFGAVTLERGGDSALSKDEICACEQLACMVGPILELMRSNERAWHARLRQTTRGLLDRLLEPGNAPAKVTALGAAALIGALLLLPVEYRISAPARIEGSIQRALVAPADGFLRHVYVRPGDNVTAEQVLVELAEEDLQLERRKWESELAQHENAAPAALSKADRTQFVISQAKADEARAQLGLVESQLTRSRIRAPFDGVLIKGDLNQSLGAPVQRGEVLLTIAPANEFRLIVEVDERDIAGVEPAQIGALALAALPHGTLSFKVERVTPVANNREGRNFFEVEAKLDGSPASLRPGQQGVAKIRAQDHPLVWIWTHRFVDWLRLTLWSWGA